MWKAFAELETLGWLDAPRKPRLISCQSDGCAPIVRAYDEGERFADPFPDAYTVASGLRVGTLPAQGLHEYRYFAIPWPFACGWAG